MEQRKPACEILVDNGIGWAGHNIGDAKTLRDAARKGCLSGSEIPKIGNHIARLKALRQLCPKRLRFVRAVCGDLHVQSPLPAPLYLWHYSTGIQ